MAEQKSFNGLKFNKLSVIGNAPSKRTLCGTLERRVIVKCECGNEKDYEPGNITLVTRFENMERRAATFDECMSFCTPLVCGR